MQERIKSFEDLEVELLDRMQARGCTPITVTGYRYLYILASKVNSERRKQGPHVLRASLASSMVNDTIPYETVRKVLGHSSNNAIKH